MTTALFIVNDAPHGKERASTALRLASGVVGKAGQNAHRQGGSRSRLCRLQGVPGATARCRSRIRVWKKINVVKVPECDGPTTTLNRSRCFMDNLP